MTTLLILTWLLPSLLCELPAIPIQVSKETTFITEPLAGDGLPNYALAIQELESEEIPPELNGAVPFWLAMGQYNMTVEEFEQLSLEIDLPPDNGTKPLVPLEDKSTIQAVADWLRETGKSSDDVELITLAKKYIKWVQSNPWTAKDVPPLAKWMADNEQALDMFVEASTKPQFYNPYPNVLVDSTIPVRDILLYGAESTRRVARALMVRAMYRVGAKDLEGAWKDCRASVVLGDHLIRAPMVIEQIVGISVRKLGFDGILRILSSSDLESRLATKIVAELTEINRKIDFSASYDFAERLLVLDFTLRNLTGRLGGLPGEKDVTGPVEIDINVTLRYINEQFDRIVVASRIDNRHERTKQLIALDKEFSEAAEKFRSLYAGIASLTFRANYMGMTYFSLLAPAFIVTHETADRHIATTELTTTAAAIAVYKAEHGHYPKELGELSPSILKEISGDLYTNEPLRYKPKGDGYLLYSLFENEFDDGGTDVDGEIRNGEWQADKQDVDREKCDLVIRMPVVPQPKP